MKKVLLIAGAAIVALAVFARQFGIDNDGDWGRSRVALLIVGLVFIFGGLVFPFLQSKGTDLKNAASEAVGRILPYPAQIAIASLFVICITAGAYIWFIQLDVRETTIRYEYYIELAKSFKKGQLHLEEEPSAALLSLSNPYDYFLRRELGIEDFPWDVSLYDGKFYIYWGPAPALLLTVFGADQLSRMGDFHIALFFACGLFIYSALIAGTFWARSVRNGGIFLLGILLLAVGLYTPITIMMKGARIYEAAILGSQFFFIGGCYWAYASFTDPKPALWKLAFASLHWGFAIGSRVIILPSVAFSVLVTLFFMVRAYKPTTPKAWLPVLAAVGGPLMLAGLGLGWYNWARFGSIFEFGLRYQLANIDYSAFENLFKGSYIGRNLYNYFAHPIKIASRFPWLTRIEYVASSDRLAGLLYVTPFILLLFSPVIRLVRNLFVSSRSGLQTKQSHLSEGWIFTTLTGSGIIMMTIIMSYYFVAMRFMEDFMPSLLTAAALAAGREYQLLNRTGRLGTVLAWVVILLVAVTVTAGILLAIPNSGISYMVNLINDINKLLGLK
ncbi:MAG: hypothetical protein C4557_02355 [Anaerolineaceae bacterium]|jgi:hypothetical protein|nr:MAG: hypothetical protein C4557_02355 [Anaerolineaceae bacterium]